MIGHWGPLVFSVSDEKAFTLTGITRTAGSTWATHTTIKGKPKSQYQAPSLRKANGNVQLRADHGVKPRAQLEKMADYSEKGYAYPLVIGGVPVSANRMKLVNVSETWGNVYSGGELFSAEVSLEFEEYV